MVHSSLGSRLAAYTSALGQICGVAHCELLIDELRNCLPALKLSQVGDITCLDVFRCFYPWVESVLGASMEHLSQIFVLLDELEYFMGLFLLGCRFSASEKSFRGLGLE